jgi:molybdopterin converting factor small subunit
VNGREGTTPRYDASVPQAANAGGRMTASVGNQSAFAAKLSGMRIPVLIPQVLCRYSGGRSQLEVEADSVQAALLALQRDHPAVYECICDETGAVRRHINLFINNAFFRDRNGLQTELVDGDVLSVFQAVSGG